MPDSAVLTGTTDPDAPPASSKLVDVAVEVSALGAQTFTYQAGEDLIGRLGLGSTVLVPFSGREVLGYVVDFPAVAGRHDLKTVIALVDALGLPEDLVRTCHWIAAYYAASVGDAVRLALPPGGNRRLDVNIEAVAGSSSSPASGKDADILEFLSRNEGKTELRELAGALSELPRAELTRRLRQLESTGRIRRAYTCRESRVREPRVRVAKLLSAAGDGIKLGPAQKNLIRTLADSGGMLKLQSLLEKAEATRAPLKELQKKGLVSVEDVPVYAAAVLGALTPLAGASALADGGTPSAQIERQESGRITLTPAQSSALSAIEKALPGGCEVDNVSGDSQADGQRVAANTGPGSGPQTFLLDGITGSGKTEVYLRAIETCLARGKGAILLVPEIALTPQTRARVVSRFGNQVAVLHSNLSIRERWNEWHRVARGEAPVVVGTRSALFAPVGDIGVIIIDEEQEGAYKQGRAPRYHAREVALKRAELSGAVLVLGTATPTLEANTLVPHASPRRLVLPDRVNTAGRAQIEVIDMRIEGGRGMLGRTMTRTLNEAFAAGEKAILLINRRGFSSFLMCEDCGHVPVCRHCAVSLTFHKRDSRLRCHHCNYSEPAPASCPSCRGPKVLGKGAGTQRAEEEIISAFPDVPIIRMDADSTTAKGAHDRHLSSFSGIDGAAILLGTQMIAKGLHFPEVTVAGVLNADSALFLPDFRAAERTYHLVTQVAGRAGRGDRPGRVLIQTFNPDHYAIVAAAESDPDYFYDHELSIRKDAEYPPFSGLTSVVISHPDPRCAESAAKRLCESLRGTLSKARTAHRTDLLGPSTAPIERIKGRYRWHFLLKYPAGNEMLELKEALSKASRALGDDPKLNVIIDVDPSWVL